MMNHVQVVTLRSVICDYSDAYILASATLTVPNTAAAGANPTNRKNIIIKNCAPFTRTFYNLTEYSDHYSRSLNILKFMAIL